MTINNCPQRGAFRTTLTQLTLTSLTLALALTSSISHAADSRSKIRETDLLPRTSSKAVDKTALSSTSVNKDAVGMAGLSRDDVGDPASFGMHAVWLGVAQTQSVLLRDDCTGTDPSYERCIKLNPQPAMTSFDEKDLAHLYIPAYSSMSLLCQWVTPFWQYQFNNLTGINQSNARITLIPYLTIANSVLSDPAAIDPVTGLPYGGEVTMTIAMTHLESRSLEAGERHLQRLNYSRVCIGGIISANNLVDQLGLPQYLADAFLQNDTKIRFHLRGNAALIDDAYLFYGARIMGDQKP